MFSNLEEDYILSLINTYKKEGYNYYLCHTVTDYNNVYDVTLYFSKKEILAYDNYTYSVEDGIVLFLDSSSRNDNSYNPSTNERIVLSNSNYNGIVYINVAEFVYTNCKLNYKTNTDVVMPDLTLNNADSISAKSCFNVLVIFVVIMFLYIFIRDILRIGRG